MATALSMRLAAGTAFAQVNRTKIGPDSVNGGEEPAMIMPTFQCFESATSVARGGNSMDGGGENQLCEFCVLDASAI